MKRLALAAIAAATFAGPLALANDAAADPPRHERRYDRDYDDRDDWRDDRRDERRAYRHGYHEGRRDEWREDRWDDRRHNGYTYRGRWHYGPPPPHWAREARYDYRHWRRGDHLPPYYRDRYRAVDYRYARLRPPPRGCHYVYDENRGEYLLVAIATGAILSVILAH